MSMLNHTLSLENASGSGLPFALGDALYQLQQLEESLGRAQTRILQIELMKADGWRLVACFFVFLMQVNFPLKGYYY